MTEKIFLFLKQNGFKVSDLKYDERIKKGIFRYNNLLREFVVIQEDPLEIIIPKGIKTNRGVIVSIRDVSWL